MAQYLLLILSLYPADFFVEKVGIAVVHDFLKQCVTDTHADTRITGRKAFLVWQTMVPQGAGELY